MIYLHNLIDLSEKVDVTLVIYFVNRSSIIYHISYIMTQVQSEKDTFVSFLTYIKANCDTYTESKYELSCILYSKYGLKIKFNSCSKERLLTELTLEYLQSPTQYILTLDLRGGIQFIQEYNNLCLHGIDCNHDKCVFKLPVI